MASPTAKGNSSIGVLLVKQPHISLANLSRFFAGTPTKGKLPHFVKITFVN